MPEWEDYYAILGINPEADAEEIKKAYLFKAWLLAPDRMEGAPEFARRQAEEELKTVNRANDELKDPEKRRKFHQEWLRRGGKTGAPGTGYDITLPKPVVEPEIIRFQDVKPRETQSANFIISNEGGPYSEIWIDDPDSRGSWVRVVDYYSTTSSELPMEVVIGAEGKDWGKSYSEQLAVRLDDIETRVRIELNTKPEPVGAHVGAGGIPSYKTPAPSPLIHRRGMPAWGKWLLGITIIAFIVVVAVGLGSQLWTTNGNSETTINPLLPPETPTKSVEPIVLKNRYYDDQKKSIDPQIEANLGEWIDENLGLKMRWISCREGEGFYCNEYLDIDDYTAIGKHLWAVGGNCGDGFIFYTSDGGQSWNIQWRETPELFSGRYPFIVHFSDYAVGWVGTKHGLLYTQDGGVNWEFRDVQGEGFYVCEYWFYDNGRIAAAFAWGETYVSTDGGKTWR